VTEGQVSQDNVIARWTLENAGMQDLVSSRRVFTGNDRLFHDSLLLTKKEVEIVPKQLLQQLQRLGTYAIGSLN
jgi:hypothetical protein